MRKLMMAVFTILFCGFCGCELAQSEYAAQESDVYRYPPAQRDSGTAQTDGKADALAKSDAGAKTDIGLVRKDEDKDGYRDDVDCDDSNPNIHPNAKEVCNGKDDNCDGKVDNSLTDTGKPCGESLGECEQGTTQCINGNLVCGGASLVLPKNELCNGKDDDCDGKVDEDFSDLGKACNEGVGECKQSGQYVCNGSATKLKCDAKPNAPQMEGPAGDSSCSDGLDNDCDGLSDLDDPDCVNCTADSGCDDGNVCTFDKCIGGLCQNKAVANGIACSDGVYCNGVETCQSGKCVSGPKVLCDDGNGCTQDSCDETQKKCVYAALASQTKEGLPGSAACLDGKDNDCDGLTDLTDPDCKGCESDYDCDNGTPCTNYICTSSKICANTPKSEGASCSDGKTCNGEETCQSGVCKAGTAVVCNDGNDCTQDSCDEAADKCVYASLPNCKQCQTNADCDDGNQCTLDKCQSGKCANSAAPDNTPCEDSAFCTMNDKCLSGSCMGIPRDCSAFADACNSAFCDEANDVCAKSPKANGTPCDDGKYCNGYESCQAGICLSGAAPVCNDNNLCTADACDWTLNKCTFTLSGNPGAEGWAVPNSCSDGKDNDCDGLVDYADPNCKQCQTNADCAGTTSACVQSVCNPVSYKCETANKPDGTTCDDGLWCTTNDQCSNGNCAGLARDCSSQSDQCNTGTCDEPSDVCKKSPKSYGTSCSDGQYCTVNDICSSGACLAGGARDCGANYTCDEAADQCAYTYKECTTSANCNDNNQCTSDVCNTSTWKCEHSNLNGSSCDDGKWCTVGDYCVNSTCQGGGARYCSSGTCDETLDTCANGGNGPGCADGSREGFTDSNVFPLIAGCSGGWSIAGLDNTRAYCYGAGDDGSNPNGNGCRAADLCATGWHVCNDYYDTSQHMPWGKTCADAVSSEKLFFATSQSSTGNGKCGSSGNNDIFGCGNFGDPPDPGTCGVFNKFSSEDCNPIANIPGTSTLVWDCDAPGDTQNEKQIVVKLKPELGGVLCCKD